MNDFCKDCLYHAWGKTPEQKQAEQTYNASYYQANKNKWVINKARRKNKEHERPPAPTGLDSLDTVATGTLTYFNDGDDNFYTYAKRGLSNMVKAMKKLTTSIGNTPQSVQLFAEEVGKTAPIKLIKNLKFVKDVKKVFSLIKQGSHTTSF